MLLKTKKVKYETVSLAGSRIVFRGEGNSSLVIGLPDRRIVLRFPKSKFIEKDQDEKLECIAKFVNNVVIPRLDSELVDPVSIAVLSLQDLQDVRDFAREYRNPSRCHKDVHFPKALILPDHTLPSRDLAACITSESVLSLELKPKLGHFFPRNWVHKSLCNFCVKQWYKLDVGGIKCPTGYCPLNLYSGDEQTMAGAIRCLMANPQNNLRIFHSGELLHTEETCYNRRCMDTVSGFLGQDCAAVLPGVLISALLAGPDAALPLQVRPAGKSSIAGGHKSACTDNSRVVLPAGSILRKVLDIQSANQITDQEAEQILGELSASTDDQAELNKTIVYGGDVNSKSQAEAEMGRLRDYLLSVTFKDLSLMLTLGEHKNSAGQRSLPRLRLGDRTFCYSWSVIDLDPKPLHKIAKYVERKRLWLEAYYKLNKNHSTRDF